MLKSHAVLAFALLLTLLRTSAQTPDMPADYQSVMTTLGKSGDFKDGVLKVNIPRNDVRVTIRQRPVPNGCRSNRQEGESLRLASQNAAEMPEDTSDDASSGIIMIE